MRIVKVGESYICPVCGKYTFEYAGDFDICPVCNWEDDLCQLENPDEEDCANHMSLNQAREAWAHGRRVDEWEDEYPAGRVQYGGRNAAASFLFCLCILSQRLASA